MLAINLVIFIVVLWICSKRWPFTAFVFGASAALYYYGIPVELSLGFASHATVFGDQAPTYEQLLQISVVATSSATLFFIGLLMAGHRDFGWRRNKDGWLMELPREVDGVGLRRRCIALVALGLTLMATLYRREFLGKFESYEANQGISYNESGLSWLTSLLCFGLALSAHASVSRSWPLVVLMSGLLCGFGLLSSDKNPILLAVLAVVPGSLYSAGTPARVRSVRTISIVSLLVIGVLLAPAFSMYRSGVRLGEFVERYQFSFTRIDVAGPFRSLVASLDSPEPPPAGAGAMYWNDLKTLIPKSLYPDRPLNPAEEFAESNIKQWAPGKGLGYSLLADGVRRYGVTYAPLQYFVLGFLWGLYWRLVGWLAIGSSGVPGLYTILGGAILVLMHRGPMVGAVKPLLIFGLPLLLVTNARWIRN